MPSCSRGVVAKAADGEVQDDEKQHQKAADDPEHDYPARCAVVATAGIVRGGDTG